MKTAEIAQWVIDNRYPKNEKEKVTDSELYHLLVERIETFANQQQWVSVEAPPNEPGQYLVTNGRSVLICGLLSNGEFFGIEGATHWMPLPTPPSHD